MGDAFGECFFLPEADFEAALELGEAPATPWPYTDDTEMALSVVAVLDAYGEIRQEELIRLFARRFDRSRGYGPSMQRVLRRVGEGEAWQSVIQESFEGQGSYGNGAAMRAGPIGAYFADDLQQVAVQAYQSCVVTHRHPEAIAGTIAVAVAAAFAWRRHLQRIDGREFLELLMPHVPASEVLSKLTRAQRLPDTATVQLAASILGNGSKLSSQDTVPLCLWCASHHLDDYEQAVWITVQAGGDRDTTCAIVGSIVALSAGEKSIPSRWTQAREPLPEWFTTPLGHR